MWGGDREDELNQQALTVFVEQPREDDDFDNDDDDVEELVPVERSSDEANKLEVIWAWYEYFVSLILGFTFFYLAPGAIGFEGAFHFGVLTTLTQGLVFMAISMTLGGIGLATNLVTNARRAGLAPLRLHFDEHNVLQENLRSYRTHMLQHIDNLHDEELLARYTQQFALDPIIENTEQKILIMHGGGAESKRDRIQRRYLDTSQWGYTSLSVIGIIVSPVSTGGLICFIVLTANAMVGQYIPIPDWAFNLSFVGAGVVGIHAFVNSILTYRQESASERDLIRKLAIAELKSDTGLRLGRETHQRLNQLIVRKNPQINVQESYAPSDWKPEVPISSVEEFRTREGGRSTYESAGFFGLGSSNVRAIFPVRPKPPKKARVEVMDEGEQDAQRNDRTFG